MILFKISIFRLKYLNSNMIGYLTLFNVLFLFSPVFSLGLQILLIVCSKTKDVKIFQNLILCISILLGVINTTKVIDSDLVNYINWYQLADRMSFYDYILMSGKEYLYNAIVYAISSITNNNQNAFVMGTTFFGYFLILNAMFRLTYVLNATSSLMLLIILSLGFLPPLFNISAQVVRQFLAGAILSVFLVNRVIQGKNIWLLFFGAVLIHSSVAFFLPFLVTPILSRPPKVLVIVSTLLGLLIVMKVAAPWLGDILKDIELPVINYIGKRMSQTKFFSLGSIGIQIYLLIIICFGMVFYKTYINKYLPITVNPQGFFVSSNLFVVLSGFIVIADMAKSTSELAGRFTFYLYVIIPIIVIMSICEKVTSMLVSVLFSVFMLTYFIFNLSFGVWTYSNILDLLVLPIYAYF